MQEIKDFIQERVNECEQRSVNWEEKVRTLTERMKISESDMEIASLKFSRQQCIGKQNELLAIADFGNQLLLKYFN